MISSLGSFWSAWGSLRAHPKLKCFKARGKRYDSRGVEKSRTFFLRFRAKSNIYAHFRATTITATTPKENQSILMIFSRFPWFLLSLFVDLWFFWPFYWNLSNYSLFFSRHFLIPLKTITTSAIFSVPIGKNTFKNAELQGLGRFHRHDAIF